MSYLVGMSNASPIAKLPLPAGKLTIRHRQMRGVWQAFAGREYLPGVAGDSHEDAALALAKLYAIPQGASVTVYGYKSPVTFHFSPEN